MLFAGASCEAPAVSLKAGYAQTRIDGTASLDSGGGSGQAGPAQDIESAFGLGSPQGSPFLRAQAAFGGPVFSASILGIRETGRGQLDAAFGGLPSATPVESRLDLDVGKITAAYEFDLGVARVAPGVLFDVYSLQLAVRELALGGQEIIDEVLFVPMPFVRVEAGAGDLLATVEAAWIDIASSGGNGGRFFDVEALVEWSPWAGVGVFAGYRVNGIDVDGTTDDGDFTADLELRGWVVGGSVRF